MKTIEEIEQYLRSKKVSGVLAVRFSKLAKQFATVEAFFSAKKEKIEETYNRITPKNKHGMGEKFWPVFNMALNFYKGYGEDPEEAPREAEPDPSADMTDKRLVKMHTYDELKAIVDMMEFCNISSINFLEIAGFLENVKFRQKGTNVSTPSESSPNGVLNAGKQ